MPASRAPEQVSQLGDKRRAVEPLVSTRGMLGEGGIFTRSEVGEAGRGLVKTRECALHWRLHLLEAPLHVDANSAAKALLHICTNLSRGSGAQKHRDLVCDLVDLLLLREVAAVFEGDDAVGGSWGEAKVNASVHLRADASILLAMENQ